MSWVRDKVYKVQYIGPKAEPISIILRNLNSNTWYDWTSKQFVDAPAQRAQALVLQTKLPIAGDTQIWEYTIDTSVLADGEYCLYYVDTAGHLLVYGPEYFGVYKGSPEMVIPKTSINITE